jgi:quercetin dioxygenase-like cupin family protein
MDSVLENAKRKFIAGEHIKNVLAGEWVELFDNHGRKVDGVRGRIGAASLTESGAPIGVDFIEMEPCAAFPPHTHFGDHLIYIIEGEGAASIDGVDHNLAAGDTIYIPAEYPHGFKNRGTRKLLFITFGSPHKHLGAHDRMKLVE